MINLECPVTDVVAPVSKTFVVRRDGSMRTRLLPTFIEAHGHPVLR